MCLLTRKSSASTCFSKLLISKNQNCLALEVICSWEVAIDSREDQVIVMMARKISSHLIIRKLRKDRV